MQVEVKERIIEELIKLIASGKSYSFNELVAAQETIRDQITLERELVQDYEYISDCELIGIWLNYALSKAFADSIRFDFLRTLIDVYGYIRYY